MPYYERIDLSKGIYPVKSNNSKKFIACHYWLFNYGFEFQDSVCNGCHELTKLCLNISNITIIIVKELIAVVLFMALANLKQFIC